MRDETQAVGQQELLSELFRNLNSSGIRYCVLHNYDSLPVYASSDIDLALYGETIASLEKLICRVSEAMGWRIIQRFWYGVPESYYYVLRSDTRPYTWVEIDVLHDPVGIGVYGFSSRILTQDVIDNGILKHAAPSIELSYKITKRIKKGYSKTGDSEIFNMLYGKSDPDELLGLLNINYVSRNAKQIIGMFPFDPLSLERLCRSRWLPLAQIIKRRMASPPRSILQSLWFAKRAFCRVMHPEGLVVLVPYGNKDLRERLTEALVVPLRRAFRAIVVRDSVNRLEIMKALTLSRLLIANHELSNDVISVVTRQFDAGVPIHARLDADETETSITVNKVVSAVLEAMDDRMRSRIAGCRAHH